MTVVGLGYLLVSGLLAGVLAELLGIGGGTVLVPILVTLGYEPIQAVATSSLAIIITSVAGLLTGGTAGLLAGIFGIGGGVIMVPLQMLLLGEPIKRAIQTSLGVIVITAIAATTGHALRGNVVWMAGIVLGLGGLISAQLSTRTLPKLPDQIVTVLFRSLLMVLVVYVLWQAWQR